MVLHFTKRETCTIPSSNHDHDNKRNGISTGAAAAAAGATSARTTPRKNATRLLNNSNNYEINENEESKINQENDETLAVHCCHGEFCSLIGILDADRDLVVLDGIVKKKKKTKRGWGEEGQTQHSQKSRRQLEQIKSTPRKQKSLSRSCKHENNTSSISKQQDIDGRTRAYMVLKKILKKEELGALEDSGDITRFTIRDKIVVERGGLEGGDDLEHIRQCIPRQTIERSKVELRWKFLALQDLDEMGCNRHHQSDKHDGFLIFDSGGGGGGGALGVDDATITSVASGMKRRKGTIMHGKTHHCYENDTLPVCDMCFHVYRLLTQVRCVQDELFCSKVLGTNEDVAFKLTLFVDKNSCTTVGGGGSGHDCHPQQQQEHLQEQQQQQYDCTGEKQDIQSQQVDLSWLLESDDDCERHGKATKVLVDGRSSGETTKSPQSLKRSNSPNNNNNHVTVGILGNISERSKVRHENQRSEKTKKFKKIPISSSENPCSFNDGNSFNDPSSYRNEIKKFAIDDVTEIVYYVMERFMNNRSLKSSTLAATKKHKHVPSQGERCNLIVCHDLFETLERMQIFLARFVERFAGQKILLWNYAGQAYTKFSERQCLNNEYHAKCLEKLMDHVGMDGTKEFVTSNSPYFVMGHGQGASIACLYAKARQHPNLRGLFLINPLSFIDTHYASVIHDCRNVFQCAPEERPDLPIYFYSRFLFSDKYLQKTSTALALNLYTAIYNPITLNGRIRLCDGVLNNVDLRDKVNNLLPPIVSVYGHDSCLIRPSLHAAAFVENRENCSTLHQVLHKKSAGRRSLVIMMEGGHELLQERKKDIHLLIEQLLTGKMMMNYEGGNKHVEHNSIAVGDRSAAKPHWSAPMPTFSQLVETVSDSVRKDNNQTHSTKNKVNKFDDDQIGGARNANSNERGEREKCHIGDKEMLLLNPNDPAFERHKNSIYKPKAGSIIYSTDVDGKSKQEYMSWRLRRNKKRLSRFQRAAKVIQGALRVYMAKTMLARLKRQTSALTIQRVYRGMVGRTIFLDKRKELWAACFVQRVYRGSLGRKTCYFTRISQKSQVNIARIWRGYIGRKIVQQIVFQRISAAIQLQSLWRRFLAVKQVETLKAQHYSAIVVQKYYRGYKGRKNANEEREKYLFSRSQMRGIELGRNILAEHKTHATRLQSELHILAKEKEMLEGKVRQITKEIDKFQEQSDSLEVSMHQVCMAEVSLKSSIYSSARASADIMIREKKSQLDDEFSSLLLKISDRKNQLQLLEEKLAQIAKTKEQKSHDLRMLERKLVVLLEAQENELTAIRSRQQKKENSILKQGASTTNAMSTQHVELKPAGTDYQHVSKFDSSNASKLMESTEAMMKFGFTSMSMTYFTALNMVKAMKSMSNQDIPFSGEQISAPLPGLQHSSENQSVQSMYTKKMKSPVSYWSVDHVVEWLKALSLGQYEDSFRDGSVDGPFLCELTDDDLMNVLGVEHKLHRKKLLLGIARLRSPNSNDGTTNINNPTQMSSTAAASSLSSPLKSQATTSLKGSSVDITSSSSSKVNLQQPLKLHNVERERTTGEIVNNIVVQPSLDDLSRWVRNQKYTLIKEALGPFPNAKFDPRDIRVQFMEGLGTIYVKSIADKLFHLNRCDEHGNTLMHIAAQNGNLRIAKLLMEKGANPNHQNKQGQTPGHFAVAYQFFDFASWLFDKNGGNGDDMILNMYGLGPYDGLVDDDDDEEDIVIGEE